MSLSLDTQQNDQNSSEEQQKGVILEELPENLIRYRMVFLRFPYALKNDPPLS